MVEMVHDVHHDNATNSPYGLIVGIVLVALVALLLFYFFGQGLNFGGNTTNPGISVPEQVDVNVNQPGGQGGQ